MLPNFLGLGAARSASTWIGQNLMMHPDIFLPRKKEIHYFDRHLDKGFEYYERAFDGWSGQRACGEITPDYFHHEAIPPMIHDILPDVKLFVSLRNPVDRAYSHYLRLIAVSNIKDTQSRPTFEEMLQMPNDILEVGFYYKHLCNYYRHFDPAKVLVLIYDDLKEDPEVFLKTIYDFLEVENVLTDSLVNQKVYSAASIDKLSKSRSLWFATRVLGRLRLYSIRGKLQKYNSSQIPEMKSETRQMLMQLYKEPNKRLEDLVRRDLSGWYVT